MPGTDLGSDTGTATVNATAKVVELFIALLNKLYEQTLDPETRLKRAQMKEAKVKAGEVKAEATAKKMDRKFDVSGGFVAMRNLMKSGEPLTTFNLKGLDKGDKDAGRASDLERIKELCEKEHIVYSGTKVEREDGKVDFNLVIREKDLERFKAVTERVNDEKRIEALDNRIAEIWSKPEITEQDIQNIRELQRQKEEIQRKSCVDLNGKQASIITENAVYDHENEPITLDEALNRNTGRSIDKDVYTIVADSQDPTNYVRCHGYMDTYKGQQYIKTDYEVYRGGEKVLSTHDGRFDGRPKDYWDTQKAAIIEAGGFTGAVFKFYSEAEYQKWAEYAARENTEELSLLEPGTERTAEQYDKAIESLKEQLKDHGVEIDEKGVLVRTVTDMSQRFDENGEIQPVEKKEPLPSILSKDLTPPQRAEIAECYAIKRQMDCLAAMQIAEKELSTAKAYAYVMDDNTPPEQRKNIEERVATAEAKLDSLKEREATLYEQRRNINAVQADHSLTADRENGLFVETEKPLQRPNRNTGKWETYIPEEEEQEAQQPETEGGEHPESMGREEVVIEDDERQKSLEEWQVVIQDEKAKQGGMETPEAQKGAIETGKDKGTTSHEDR